ncbi:hypothetical protein D3C86_1752660 [compost metagenome]
MVIVSPIAVFFAVCLIVFLIETNAVAQGEPVVRCHQIDTGGRLSAGTPENIAGRGKAPGKLAQRQTFFEPETASTVTVIIVPLGKQRREISHLIATVTNIPRLGDQLDA